MDASRAAVQGRRSARMRTTTAAAGLINQAASVAFTCLMRALWPADVLHVQPQPGVCLLDCNSTDFPFEPSKQTCWGFDVLALSAPTAQWGTEAVAVRNITNALECQRQTGGVRMILLLRWRWHRCCVAPWARNGVPGATAVDTQPVVFSFCYRTYCARQYMLRLLCGALRCCAPCWAALCRCIK